MWDKPIHPLQPPDSGLAVVFSIDASAAAVCSINSAGKVTFISAGTCVVDANQDGDASYNPAPQVQQSIPVSQGVTPTPIAPAHIVISEFRSRGPLGEGDEFVEIYNPTGGTVNIGSWTIRSSSGCSTNITILATINANTLLKPGQHYLVAPADSTYANFADKESVVGIDDDGGVGLVSSNTTVTDMAGMCNTTTYREPTSGTSTYLAPLLDNIDQAYERKPVGATSCYDTNDNSKDFALVHPVRPAKQRQPDRDVQRGGCLYPHLHAHAHPHPHPHASPDHRPRQCGDQRVPAPPPQRLECRWNDQHRRRIYRTDQHGHDHHQHGQLETG